MGELASLASPMPPGQRHDPRVAEKIDELMEAVKLDPFHGIGKPKHLSGFWSRRITEEHRLLYEVVGDQVNVLIPIPDRMRGNSIWNWNARHGGRARNAKHFGRQGESRLAAAD